METSEQGVRNIKEIEPRGKVLFINMSPTSEIPSFKIASEMFGEGRSIEDFNQMMLTGINSPKLLENENSGSLRQIKESTLPLPSVDEAMAVVITGSPFSGSLLTRDVSKFGLNREGKGVFMPFWQKDLAAFINEINRQNKPMLGICFGMQMITEALGGKVEQTNRQVGFNKVIRTEDGDPVMSGVPETFVAVTNHDRSIIRVPGGAKILARNEGGVQAFKVGRIYGFLFHPEKTKEDAENLLTNPKNQGKFDQSLQEELKAEFDQKVMKGILTNFTKVALSSIQ